MPIVAGGFDDLRSAQVRFLEEAARLGPVHVFLLTDRAFHLVCGAPPRFPLEERLYLLQAIRFVDRVTVLENWTDPHALPIPPSDLPDTWVVMAVEDAPEKRAFCQASGLGYRVIAAGELEGFPTPPVPIPLPSSGRKRAVVTGCFDWLHSGHVRFFEEVSTLGDLFVIVGHDANLSLLKGDGHPLFGQDERRYMVQAIRYVSGSLISSGDGWMDAEPEIGRLQPDLYVVNEDGDKPEKRAFCAVRGIEYIVLQRRPKDGLPRRESTYLRGF